MLDHDSIIPLYEQISEKIKEEIQKGTFGSQKRLPTEGQLAEQYGVSRITIRSAITELVKQGLVNRKQGKGTFITTPSMQKDFKRPGTGFTQICLENGQKASSKVLEAGIFVPDDPKVIEWLELKEGDEAVRIVRLRYVGDMPCIIEENIFPMKYSYLLDIDLTGSIYKYLKEEKNIDVVAGELILNIIRPDQKTARLLQKSKNTPLLKISGRSFSTTGEILHVSKTIGYGEEFDYIIR
ncbi:GntR family transcriptional regulator [Dethiosulfatibacter aminovorans DSM 17477]|uniref:GntR family transcriptional regulator n=1 Tax=Dethiosulfatibacter aminovorans DSM 17477 TaxID=1121476 RepID=A0A1M6L2W9_9FIRM|nr:GntR family transcriptional regulator [Dethiosulfatibacter aminovorans]SHJ65578.1 GntR family transcriptional regulator [Dethiosulfatibacter aminovorans DSM 17477]